MRQGQNNGNRRPIRGYHPWKPHSKTRLVMQQVNEVLEEYEDHLPLTIRQIFYRLVGAYGYEKTEQAYGRLVYYMGRARRANKIRFDHIRDDGVFSFPSDNYAGLKDFHDETARRIRAYRRDRQERQPVRLELWCEAAGMLAQLNRVAREYSVQTYSGSGFDSLTAKHDVAKRALEQAVPTVILHLGDYDPSGESIFEAITEDAASFVERDRVIQTQKIIGRRVALTADQVAEHQLPTAPAKESDSRSKSWKGHTCQLEAMRPDAIAAIVEQAIQDELDLERYERVLNMEADDRSSLLELPRGDDDHAR